MTINFSYSPMFPLMKDSTEYEFLGSEFIKTENIGGRTLLCLKPEALSYITEQAFLESLIFTENLI